MIVHYNTFVVTENHEEVASPHRSTFLSMFNLELGETGQTLIVKPKP